MAHREIVRADLFRPYDPNGGMNINMFGAEGSFSFLDMSIFFGSVIGFWMNTGSKKPKKTIIFYCVTALIILFVLSYPDKIAIFIDCVKMLLNIGLITLIFFLEKIDKRRAARKAAGKNNSEK